jgi:hypothetical protein
MPYFVLFSRLIYSNSLYISCVESNFHGTEIEFGLVLGWLATLKKIGDANEQVLRDVFLCFHGQKKSFFFFKYCSVRTKTLYKMKVKKNIFFS